ncbi:hypothetical protein FRB99_007135 [Tulasnella sp. 403]|nr:hypothetical protein FRB99_007135 [Tulasnella sp. 403]
MEEDGSKRHWDVDGASGVRKEWTKKWRILLDSLSRKERPTENTSGGSESAPRDVEDLVYEAARMTKAAVQSSNIEKLEEAVVFVEKAADACSANPVLRSHALDSLGRARCVMFEETGIREHIERAVEAREEAMKICPSNHSDRPRLLANLACVLYIRFQTSANIEDLKRCIALREEALVLGQPQSRSLDLQNLASSLRRRFEVTANLVDLDRCIVLQEAALELASPPDRPSRLWNLGGLLHTRFENTAHISDLEKSVAVLHEAAALSKSDEDRRDSLNWLANSLLTRYRQTRNMADLGQSITLYEAVLELCSATHIDRPMYLNNLAASLSERFRLDKSIADLDRVIALQEETLVLTPPTHIDCTLYLRNLAVSLDDRFALSDDINDLDKSITLYEQALNRCPTTHIERRDCLVSLTGSLSKRFEHKRDVAHLDRAIQLAQSALETLPPHHPQRSECLDELSLVQLHHIRETTRNDSNHVCDHSTLQIDDIIHQLREAAHALHSPSNDRLIASLHWIDASNEFHQESLFDAYSAVYDILDVIITRGHSLETRYNQLATDEWITKAKSRFTDAVGFAIAQNRPRDAVVFLERGRALLLAQVGHFRMPFDDIRERDPELAAQLESVGRQLDHALASDPARNSSGDDPIAQSMRLTSEWNALVERARKLDGCHDFLKPTPFQSLQQGATAGPVIFVNIAESSSHAIIVFPVSDPVVVPLPGATPSQVDQLTHTLLDARDRQARTFILALRHLWDIVVGPVVDQLKAHTPPQSRIWWCPSAAVAELPLHAAGYYFKGADPDRHLPHLFVSSYTSSLGALIRARRTTNKQSPPAPSLLVISQPNTRGEIELNVRDEIIFISNKLPTTRVLEGPDGTSDAVVAAILDYSWAHFSCHAYSISDNPLRSYFSLHESRLHVLDILRTQHPQAELAILTACHTAGAGTSAPEEFLHLAGAMQFAGFRSVVGTSWAMDDSDGSFIVKGIYRRLFEELGRGNRLVYTCVAKALNEAVDELQADLKRRKIAEPWRWVNYVHYGA